MKKRILIIITGGTITMKDYNDSIDISEKLLSKLNSSNVLSSFDLDFKIDIFSSKPSPNFSCLDMFSLANHVEDKIRDESLSGIIIAHGTDTIEETSFFFDLFFSKLSIPIIFTGSMKIFTDPSYDGYDNLISSILVSLHKLSINFGVMLVFHNKILSPIYASKFNTKNINAFKSINFPNIGFIKNGLVFLKNKPTRFLLPKISKLIDKVYIYKTFSGDSGFFFNNLITFSDAIIVEGFGSGNVSKSLVPAIKKAISKNITIVISSRVPTGPFNSIYNYPGGGKDLANLGCFYLPNLSTQKSRILIVYLNSLDYSNEDFASLFNNFKVIKQ